MLHHSLTFESAIYALAPKLDQRNRKLQAEMQANVKAREAADEECSNLLDILEEVRRICSQSLSRLTRSVRLKRSGMKCRWKKSNHGPCKPPNL